MPFDTTNMTVLTDQEVEECPDCGEDLEEDDDGFYCPHCGYED